MVSCKTRPILTIIDNDARPSGEDGALLIGADDHDILIGGENSEHITGGQGNDTLTGGGNQDLFVVSLGNGVDVITDFTGVGTGVNPSTAVIEEVDTLKFDGEGLTAQNMLLTQDGSDLLITFEGIDNTGVVLEDFVLEDLDNLRRVASASVDLGNILFAEETAFQDSFDVFNANQQRSQVFNQNTVTFLNNLDNRTRGFDHSNDVINGQGGDDWLAGLSGDDLLRGRDGDDILIGGFGKDTLIGGNDSDMFVFAPRDGFDTIIDFTDTQDFSRISRRSKLY